MMLVYISRLRELLRAYILQIMREMAVCDWATWLN